jgi:hypothetical protein
VLDTVVTTVAPTATGVAGVTQQAYLLILLWSGLPMAQAMVMDQQAYLLILLWSGLPMAQAMVSRPGRRCDRSLSRSQLAQRPGSRSDALAQCGATCKTSRATTPTTQTTTATLPKLNKRL